ncbi:DoxX family protein [Planctomycetota bacterium]
MVLNRLDKFRDLGLLILRVGIGVMFIFHGWPKLMGGPEKWNQLGQALGALGLTLHPTLSTVMGFLAALSETGGGVLLILGFFMRPACLALLGTMTVATIMHVKNGDGFIGYSHALEAGILFLSLILIGPGKYSLDAKCTFKRATKKSAAD